MASTPRLFFRASDSDDLVDVFERIQERILKINIRLVQVKDTLGTDMSYVPGSAVPPQNEPEHPDRWLIWEDVYIPQEGVTYTVKAKPLRTGHLPTNLEAIGRFTDNKGRSKDFTFSVPWVTVLEPFPLATRVPLTGGKVQCADIPPSH
jgi:hypothetical protein